MSETTPEPTPEPQPEPTPDEPTEPAEGEPAAPEPGEPTEPEAPEVEPPAEEPPAPETAGEAAQPEGLTQAEAEARFKKADKSFENYVKRVSDLWEDEAVHLLPVSISPSAPPGFIDVRDAGRVPDEMKQPIMEFFGMARARDYKPDPETQTCRTCDGEGKTATGSKVPGNESHKCPICQGFGYVPPPLRTTNGPVAAEDFHAPAGEAVAPLADDERDMWGEAHLLPDGRENPNYGKMPQHKIPVQPWGVTANLTAQDAPVSIEG